MMNFYISFCIYVIHWEFSFYTIALDNELRYMGLSRYKKQLHEKKIK